MAVKDDAAIVYTFIDHDIEFKYQIMLIIYQI